MRRAVRITGWTMIWSGLFVLGFAGYQLLLTDVVNSRSQERAEVELVEVLSERRAELPVPTTIAPSTTAGETPGPVVHHPEEEVAEGAPLGTFRIPKLGLEVVLISGVTPESLKLGPGHMPWTPLPGQPGNAVVSGHRTTYGRPFFLLDELSPGDVIEVETAIGVHRYEVRETEIVLPTDVWVTNPRPGAWLTLTTCNPRYSARERLIIFAEMTAGPNLDYARYLMEEGLQDLS